MLAEDLDAQKRNERKRARARRAEAFAAAGSDAGRRLAENILATLPLEEKRVISAFWPLEGEIDTLPVMAALHEAGHTVVLPVMLGMGRPLIFRQWAPGDKLVEAAFKTQEPSAEKPEWDPEILLVPLLAYDLEGYRLGYGGGFYDRTLADLRADGGVLTAGIAFDGQGVDEVPHGIHDQSLDYIVTDRRVIPISTKSEQE